MRLILAFLLLVTLVSVNGGRGGGRGGGGRSGGGRSGGFGGFGGRSSSGRSSSSSRSSSTWSGSSRSTSRGGKGSSLKKKLIAGAAIGAGAYVGYKATKAVGKFAAWSAGHSLSYQYNDWDQWRRSPGRNGREQGMLCRNNGDCWLDPNLECQDYDLDFDINRGWFGGDYLSIIGACDCRAGQQWDDRQLECQQAWSGGPGGFFAGVVGILVILLMIGVGICCCVGFACWFCRR